MKTESNRRRTYSVRKIMALCLVLVIVLCQTVFASSSDDNSLADLGIITEGATVTPEVSYGTYIYDVTVPAGTTELELDPRPTNSAASIVDITGTTLNEDGTGTVFITVQAGNGDQFTYQVNVTTAAGETDAAAETATEAQTETQVQTVTEAQAQTDSSTETETETEDSNFVKVDKNALQEAENTITELKNQITEERNTINQYTKIIYGLIIVSVVLLFAVINLILRKRDIKAELNEYRKLGYSKKTKRKNNSRNSVSGTAGKNARGYSSAVPGYRSVQENGVDRGGSPYGQRSTGQKQGGKEASYVNLQTDNSHINVEPQTSHHTKRIMPAYETNSDEAQNSVRIKSTAQGTIYGKMGGREQEKTDSTKVQEAAASEKNQNTRKAKAAARQAARQAKAEAKIAAEEEKAMQEMAREEAKKRQNKEDGSRNSGSGDDVKVNMIDL